MPDLAPFRIKVECINWLAGPTYDRARVSVLNQSGHRIWSTELRTWGRAMQKASSLRATLLGLSASVRGCQ